MLISTGTHEININLVQEIDDFPLEHIGIKMSGGVKSNLIAYLIAKEIYEKKLKATITPLVTLVEGKSYQELKVPQAVEFIKEQFDTIEFRPIIWNNHAANYDPVTEEWTDREQSDKIKDLSRIAYFPKGKENTPEGFYHRSVDCIYTGLYKPCPPEVAETIHEYHNRDRGYEDEEVQDYRAFTPFINLTYADIIDLYKQNDIHKTLLPMGFSCNRYQTTFIACGECSWCKERDWATKTVIPPSASDSILEALRNYPIG